MDNNAISLEGRTRLDILNAAKSVGKKGAHIAPSLSMVEICLSILDEFNPETDSFVLSKGHGALGYYAAMHQKGIISDKQFESFEENGGEFPGQPSRTVGNNIEYSGGSLGMGLPYALGVALAKKHKSGTVYVIVGDGELNEGSNWEAAALASRYNLDNLVVVVDNNGLQSDGKCSEIVGQNYQSVWNSFGWHVEECDGHSINDLKRVLGCNHKNVPLVVIAKTIKGKGISFMENDNAWHHSVLKEEDYLKAVQEVKKIYELL